jgi:hypothetical protein
MSQQVATLDTGNMSERSACSMKRAEEEDIRQILERLEKLSQRPENPGMAYRNLETINALISALRSKLGETVGAKG